jgi:1-acyl-sn-glycerol-3-phosphate acyltransferase
MKSTELDAERSAYPTEKERASLDGKLSDLLAYARFWFAMICTAISAVVFFTLSLFGFLMPRALGRRWMLQAPILWSHVVLWAAGCPVDTEFEAELPQGGFLLFANHQSSLDIIALFYAMRQRPLAFAAKRELFSVPVIGWYLRAAGFIEVDRGNRERAIKSYQRAGKQLGEGAVIGIYPEGTRSIDGTILPFKKGPFVLALNTQVPIVPAAVEGAQHAVRKHTAKLYGNTIRIRVGAPIETKGLTLDDRDALLIKTRKAVLALHLRCGAEASAAEPMIAPPGKRSGEREA